MKRFLILFLFPFLPNIVFAQQIISGKVADKKGEPLVGVNITIKDSYDGATTDAQGQFQFETTMTDSVVIIANYIGFAPFEKSIFISKKNEVVNIILKEKINELKAVVISAGSFEASDQKKGTVLNALDMVTTAGSNGDNYSALKTLPGTQQTNDREGLFVRGGTGTETQTFIDGTIVRNAFSTSVPDLGSRGRFSPFIFKGTVFSTGGYSAIYGQALSSALILESIDLPDRSSANLTMTSVGLGGSVQQLAKSKKYSYGIGYNYINLTPYFKIAKQNIHYNNAPTSHQFDANFRVKTSNTGMLKFYGYYNQTLIDVARDNVTSLDYGNENKKLIDDYRVKNFNAYFNLSYKEYLKNNWKVEVGSCASMNKDNIDAKILNQKNEITIDTNFLLKEDNFVQSKNQIASAKFVLEKSLKNLNAIRFGAEYIYDDEFYLYEYVPLASSIQYNPSILHEHYNALFAESDIYITNHIAGKIGVRAEHSSLLNQWNLAPRLSTAYKLNKNSQLSLAYGMYYQKPDYQYLFSSYTNLDFQRADHYILNYQYQENGRFLRLETYYKQYHDLVKTPISTMPTFATSNGSGYARGIELFYRDKKSFKGIDYWIAYSYLDTKRDFLNYLKMVQPDFAATHTANLVVKKFWNKYMFGINGTYTFSSGRPYVNYNTSNPNLPNPDAGRFMEDRTIAYHNVGLSANYVRKIQKAFTVFVIGVNNPFGFKQIYGYNYATKDLNKDGYLYRKAITPTARQFVFIGIFVSFGIDRTQDAIDNNL
ncbi:MAG: TonB-dependent receptor [Chitinophagaceae bacterium]|nr:MAG: TonB-dependent receptor plug [Bacteroidetes bacterium OLB11]MCC6447666.1 TonB-dependent receptor [Chitinophagaceae bacterium]HMN32601.1 TonB-dependent receptor [Chitinophagaceae bacterium]